MSCLGEDIVDSSTRTLHNIIPKRDFFYIGGQYTDITDANGDVSQFMLGQIYVEKLSLPHTQISTSKLPIIFISGAGQTGTNWLETPDGRPGWAAYFLSRDHTVYLSDQPSRGRSAWHPSQGKLVTIGSNQHISNLFTCTAQNGDLWPQAKLHTQWPGTGRAGCPIFDSFYASQVALQSDKFIGEESNAKAYTALIDKVGPCYLITHSQSGAYGWRVGDMRPDLVKGIIALEPSGPPFFKRPPQVPGPGCAFGITDLPIAYDPPAGPNAENLSTVTIPAPDASHYESILQTEPAKRLVNLSKIPVLVVTGEASYHAPYDYNTAQFLKQAGVNVEHADLGQEGIKGNGHMLFMEKNNIEIAERVYRWLEQQAK